MALPSVLCVRIDERQRDNILNCGFDPPGEGILPEVFCQEIRQVCDQLQERLSQVREYGIGDGDFFIHTSSEQDRMLCVEITRTNIIDDRLLNIAHAAVMEIAENYCVDFCNDAFNLKINSDQFYPDFNILVSKSMISIYSECDDLMHILGISDSLQWDEKKA